MSPRAVRAREAAGAAWPLADQPALCAQLLEDYLLADLMPGLFAATPITRRGAELSVAFVPHPLYAIYAGRMYRFDWDTAAATLTLRFAIAGPAVFRALEPDLRVRLLGDDRQPGARGHNEAVVGGGVERGERPQDVRHLLPQPHPFQHPSATKKEIEPSQTQSTPPTLPE